MRQLSKVSALRRRCGKRMTAMRFKARLDALAVNFLTTRPFTICRRERGSALPFGQPRHAP
jgi:hypothetical protein